MQFNSLQFLIFFPIAVLGYFVLPKKLKNPWLLVLSYYFYMIIILQICELFHIIIPDFK